MKNIGCCYRYPTEPLPNNLNQLLDEQTKEGITETADGAKWCMARITASSLGDNITFIFVSLAFDNSIEGSLFKNVIRLLKIC